MKLVSRLRCITVFSAAAAVIASGCSSSETKLNGATREGPANSVGLALQPVAGVTINLVHFVVSKEGFSGPVLEGDLPTPGTASTFNVGLPIPVGVGYTLSLSGVSVESAAINCTGSIGPFAVTPNQTTKLTTTFACTDANKGALDDHVTVTTDACPRLSVDYLIVTPNSAAVGSTIGTFSKATELDGKPVNYAWKVGNTDVGSFAAATSANTTFTCNAGGVDVPLTVTANNGQCSKSLATTLSCGNINCGDGIKGPDEACDPKLSVDNCGRDCLPITSTSCLACEQTNECADFVDCFQLSGNGAVGTPGAGIPKAQMCNEVLDCVRDSGCARTNTIPPVTPIKCYCGTASPADCQNGLGNGVCKAELERGLETVAFGQIAQRLKNTFFGGGLAMARVDCDSQLCSGACGLD